MELTGRIRYNAVMAATDDFRKMLLKELQRVGRAEATLTMLDNAFVTIADGDGSWTGPGPSAQIALAKTPDGKGGGVAFWTRFPK